MPIESNKPPDSQFDKMTSADNIVHSSLNGNNDKAVKFKNHKPHRGIKVSTPVSAGAGSVLRRLHSAKVSGKARGRADESPGDNKGGNFVLNEQCSPVAKSCGPMSSPDHTGMGDVGNTSCGLASLKDGMTIAETGIVCDREIAGSGTSNGRGSGASSSGWNAGVGNKSEEMALKMEFTPNSVIKQENGKRRIEFTAKDIVKGGQACSMQLYRYFVGTSMNYRVVRGNLMRMWRAYDIEDITKTNSGVFYFKFKSEDEPSLIPIWICVYNIPMELCNGNGIGKIMSSVGKPLLMDNMTKERCLKKAAKLDFARVLVEVSAEDDLPCLLEISYPPIGNRSAKVGVLDVKYQWKPPLCTHCRTFGHSTLSCKVRPRTKEEIATKNLKDALKISNPNVDGGSLQNVVDDGFTVKGSSFRRNNGVSGMSSGKNNSGKKAPVQEIKKKSLVVKPVLAFSYNQNFRPKVLVRGSGSAVAGDAVEARNSDMGGAPFNDVISNV
uniref:Uncharacterized protein n=1 Tax=Tanacetum cinerariifolium TaxID=118510 RepID=A0A6L2KB60_TANCI|nr:hypothetical protein [Tanacetum cinerariifolium]